MKSKQLSLLLHLIERIMMIITKMMMIDNYVNDEDDDDDVGDNDHDGLNSQPSFISLTYNSRGQSGIQG